MVRQTLERRSKRRLAVRSLEPAMIDMIDVTIAELSKLGLIDDAKFAETRAASLVRKGLSRNRVAQGLRAKGIDKDTIERAVTHDIDELVQARRFIERKRLGSLRRGGLTLASRKKDLGVLARAGFGFAVAVKALSEPEAE